MANWKNEVINDVKWNGDGIYSIEFEDNAGTKFHQKMPKGAALRDLQHSHLHLSYWETPYYKGAIDRFLADLENIDSKIAIDIGCGDGRFSEFLIELGFKKIIVTDSDLKPLESLYNYAKERGFSDRILAIHCSADNIPVHDECVDVSLAIGVFYYMNDKYEDCIRETWRVLKKGGVFINSEPDMEGAVYKSIFFEELDDVLENFHSKKFKEEKGQTDFKFRLFERDELRELLRINGFNVLDCHGLSLLPSILRIKMVRGEFPKESVTAMENDLRKIFDHFDQTGSLYKHVIWKSQKM